MFQCSETRYATSTTSTLTFPPTSTTTEQKHLETSHTGEGTDRYTPPYLRRDNSRPRTGEEGVGSIVTGVRAQDGPERANELEGALGQRKSSNQSTGSVLEETRTAHRGGGEHALTNPPRQGRLMEPAIPTTEAGFEGFRRTVTTCLGDGERRRRGIIHLQYHGGDGSHTIFLHYPKPS